MIVLNIIYPSFNQHCDRRLLAYCVKHRNEKREYVIPMEDVMVGYESLAWIKDKNGKEYVCPIDALKGDISDRV